MNELQHLPKKAKTKKTRTIKVTDLLVVHLNLQGVLKALL